MNIIVVIPLMHVVIQNFLDKICINILDQIEIVNYNGIIVVVYYCVFVMWNKL